MATDAAEREADRDATVIAYVVALIQARRKRDYLAATRAHKELERRGVLVKFPQPRKAVSHA